MYWVVSIDNYNDFFGFLDSANQRRDRKIRVSDWLEAKIDQPIRNQYFPISSLIG
jgi:hypothetical protein